MPSSLRSGRRPAIVSLTAASSASPFIEPEHTKPPGMASTSTPNAGDLRSPVGISSGTRGLILTTVSPGLRWTRRARTTTPRLFSVRSGVSKKATWRICASSGSMPRFSTADLRLASGTLSFSSTLSEPLISLSTSAICSVENRLSRRRPALAVALVVSVVLLTGVSSVRVRQPNGSLRRLDGGPDTGGMAPPERGWKRRRPTSNYPTWGGLRPPDAFVRSGRAHPHRVRRREEHERCSTCATAAFSRKSTSSRGSCDTCCSCPRPSRSPSTPAPNESASRARRSP